MKKILGAIAALVFLCSVMLAGVASPASAEQHRNLYAVDSTAPNATGTPLLYTDCDCIPDTLNGPKDHRLYAGFTAEFTYTYVFAGDNLWCRFEPDLHWQRVFTATGWHAASQFPTQYVDYGNGPRTYAVSSMGCELRSQ